MEDEAWGLGERYEIEETADYIIRKGYQCVGLQFPDELLPDSPAVVVALRAACSERLSQAAADQGDASASTSGASGPGPEISTPSSYLESIAALREGQGGEIPPEILPQGGRGQHGGSPPDHQGGGGPRSGLDGVGRPSSESAGRRPAGAGPGQSKREGMKLYVLADATYGSCCVDEVAAAHAAIEAVVHYGPACLSPTARLPVRFVLGRAPVDVRDCCAQLARESVERDSPLLVLYGLEYAHCAPDVREALASLLPTAVVAEVEAREMEPGGRSLIQAPTECCGQEAGKGAMGPHTREKRSASLGGLTWTLPGGASEADYTALWIGNEGAALTCSMLTYNHCKFLRYDPGEKRVHADAAGHDRLLRRRHYLVEKAKDAAIVGIVVGTLGVVGYREAIRGLREMIAAAGKKSYTLVMGRPSPAKLANFPECEVFVSVACPQTVLLDSRDYLAPVITPFEASLAFTKGKLWTGAYRLDFAMLLDEAAATGDSPGALDMASDHLGNLSGARGGISGSSEGAPEEDDDDGEDSEEPRFSLVTGSYVKDRAPRLGATKSPTGRALATVENRLRSLQPSQHSELALQQDRRSLEVRSSAEYLALRRDYRGLEVGPQDGDASQIVIGRTGRAAGYTHEIQQIIREAT